MSILSVFSNSEKVNVAIVEVSDDRMSSETRETMTAHRARDNMQTLVKTTN
jgi:hypothetical protein